MKKSVVILGAGITGLSAAWKLSESGMDVNVVDISSDIGGLSSTVQKNGFIFDYGIHGWFPSIKGNEEIVAVIKNLPGIEWINVKKETSIYFNDRYLKYPLRSRDLFLAIKPLTALFCLIDFVITRLRLRLGLRVLSDESFKGWIVNRFGNGLYNIYFGPYAQKVWGVPPELLASGPLLRRVTTVSIWDAIRKAILHHYDSWIIKRKRYPQQPSEFLYSKGGAVEVAKAIARKIEISGGKILLENRPQRLNLENNRIREIVIEGKEGNKSLPTDYIVSTIPINSLMGIINPEPNKILLELSKGLKYRALICVFLLLNKDRVTKSQWIYYSGKEFLFNRINEFTNIHPSFSPAGKTGLCLEVSCFSGDEVWSMSDEQLYEKCIGGLASLKLVSANEVENYYVSRKSDVYPLFEIVTEHKLNEIFAYLGSIRNLFWGGRQGSFTYINMDECVKEGFTTADKIIKEGAQP